MNMKALIISAMMGLAIVSHASLYIVSGGDFRTPRLSWTLNVTDVENPIPVYNHTWQSDSHSFSIEISDGFKTNLTINTSTCTIWHKFNAPGTYRVRLFQPYFIAGQKFAFPPQLSNMLVRVSQNKGNTMVNCQKMTTLQEVVVKDGVVAIPVNGFRNCANLVNVYLPDSIQTIGNDAFNMNEITTSYPNLVSVRLPRNPAFTNLQNNVFFRCKALKSLVVPSNVVRYGQWVFHTANDLESITLGPSQVVVPGLDGSFKSIGSKFTTVNYYGTIEQWKADGLSEFFGTTDATPEAGVNTIEISGGTAVGGRAITLNFNYPEPTEE